METPIPTKERKKTEQKQSTIVPTLDCADESAALGVLEDDAEVGAPQHGGVAVDVVDGELDGGPGGPSDDGVEGEEGADGDVGRARRLQGDWQDGAEAEQPEEEGGGGRRHHLTSAVLEKEVGEDWCLLERLFFFCMIDTCIGGSSCL